MSGGLPAVIRLSRELARNFAHEPDGDRALDLATHIEKFWEPRMQRELLQHVRAGDPSLDPIVVAAAAHLVVDDVDEAELRKPSGG